MLAHLPLLRSAYCLALLLNFVVAYLQKSWPGHFVLHRISLHLWACALIGALLECLFPDPGLANALSFAATGLVSFCVSALASGAMGIEHRPRAWLVGLAAALFSCVTLWALGMPYEVYVLPVALGVSFPLVSLALRGLWSQELGERTPLEKLYLLNALALGLSLAASPLIRDVEEVAVVAFSLRFVGFHLLSVLVPLLIREQAERARQKGLLGEIAESLSHEVNTPLTVVCLTANLLRRAMCEGTLDRPFVTRHLEVVEQSCMRIARIIRRICFVSRFPLHEPGEPAQVVSRSSST